MGDNNKQPTNDASDDEPEFKRRQVLAGIGGTVATGSMASFAGVSDGSDRVELEQLLEELEKDAELLAEHDLAELSPAKQREFAEKGRQLKFYMEPECGFEGYEVDGGPYNGCCGAHDICEGYNDAPDHVFNGDSCDGMFWSCVAVV